jgi:hypothetical protein
MLVIVTFDLHGAPSGAYLKLKSALAAQIKLEKNIRSKKSGKLNRLPDNTFAAKFGGKWNRKQTKQLRSKVRKTVVKAIMQLHLSATVFVAVADGWAWSKRTVP